MNKEIREFIAKINCFNKSGKLEIINYLLNQREATLGAISKALRIKDSTVYKYLKQMQTAGLITKGKLPGKKGKFIFRIEDISLLIDAEIIRHSFKQQKQEDFLIIFDVDDTLVRRTDISEQLALAGKNAITEAKHLLQEKGNPISMPPYELFNSEWIHSKYGNSVKWYIKTWLSVAGVQDNKIKESLTRKYEKEYYRKIEITGTNCRLFKDVIPFLEHMKYKAYFAAMSNSSRNAIIATFRNNNILKFFMKDGEALIVGGDEIPKSKETVQFLLKMADIGHNQCFLIGDTGGDVKAAREAGIPCHKVFVVARGIIPEESIKVIRPNVKIINNLLEVLPFFD